MEFSIHCPVVNVDTNLLSISMNQPWSTIFQMIYHINRFVDIHRSINGNLVLLSWMLTSGTATFAVLYVHQLLLARMECDVTIIESLCGHFTYKK